MHARNGLRVGFLACVGALMGLPSACYGQGEAKGSDRLLLVGDYTGKRVAIHSDSRGILWEHEAPGVYDVCMRPNGNVIFSTYPAVLEVTPDLDARKGGTIVWRYACGSAGGTYEGKTEVHGCHLLPSGNVMISEAGSMRLVEVSPLGEVVGTIPLPPSKTEDVHAQLSLVRSTGSTPPLLLVAYMGDGEVKVLDRTGRVVKTFPVGQGRTGSGTAYVGQPLADGHVLIGCADANCVVEFDGDGKEVWGLGADDVPEVDLSWTASVYRLPGGNTLVCNWARGKSSAKAFEVTPAKEVVWQLDGTHFKGISCLQVLDEHLRPPKL